jgi:Ankyrin repeats (many copies)
MSERGRPSVEIIDLGPGLWIWRLEHPGWNQYCEWQEVVTSVCVEAGAERWLLDPLLPPTDATQVWDRMDERPPTAVALLIPDHADRMSWSNLQVRSFDAVVARYRCRAFGPDDWSNNKPPETTLQKIVPGEELPGGLMPFRDPRGWSETPIYSSRHKTLVFGDALTERGGVLRIWGTPHMERARSDLRAMLDLPFERLVISHGQPVHTREALERALELPGWPTSTPLHHAAWDGDFDRVRRLVEEGADVTAKDEAYDATALDWAKSGAKQEWAPGRKHQEVIDYLNLITDKTA